MLCNKTDFPVPDGPQISALNGNLAAILYLDCSNVYSVHLHGLMLIIYYN